MIPMGMEKLIEVETLIGQVVGFRALFGYNRIAFVSHSDGPCVALSSAMNASYISATGGESRIFLLDEEFSVVRRLRDYSPNLIVLSVGCVDEKLKDMLSAFLLQLMDHDVDSDFLFSLYSPTLEALEILRKNSAIRNYLADKRVMGFILDSDNGMMELKDIYLLEDEFYSEVVEQYPISLKLSLEFSNLEQLYSKEVRNK